MKKISSVDRLSELPDSILHHIFSSLETREIVQASLLSRRWRGLWTSTPYLNFFLTRSKSKFSPLSWSEKIVRKCFVNYVYRVLILRDAVSTIQNLHLCSESLLDEGHVLTWLMGALKQNVKVLHLELHLNQTLDLPPDLFTSEITTLTVIDNALEDEYTIQLPKAVCSAARITSLKLEYVKFPEGATSDGELVLSCPVLENLTIYSCDDKHLKTLTISSPLLKRLDFTNENVYDDPFKLNVCSPNLTSIYFFCWGYVDISLVNLAVVVSACMNIFRYEEMDKEVYAQLMIKVFRMISNIRALSLPAEVVKEITDSSMILEKLPSVFQNLKNIMFDDGGANGILITAFSIFKVLETSPSIQVIVWDRTKSKPPNLKKNGKNKGEKLPIQDVLRSLRTVKIQNPHGVEDELKFLEFVLESAIYLEEIIITTTQKTNRLTEFCQKLLALPRSSSYVSIHCSC